MLYRSRPGSFGDGTGGGLDHEGKKSKQVTVKDRRLASSQRSDMEPEGVTVSVGQKKN